MSFVEGEITVEFGGTVGPAGPAGNAVPIAAGTVLANPSGVLANPVGVDAAGMRTLIGLGSVDNTADTAKPVSTATQTAINAINDVNVFPSFFDVTGVKAGDLVIIEGDKVYRATGPSSFVAVLADPTSHTHNTSGIVDNAVTYAKMQDVSAASRLIGRGSASGAGDPQEITFGSGLAMSGTVLSVSVSGSPPASASATGTAGTIIADASYIYICTATNTWKRVAIATW
jgi:hypothetical protein